MIVFPLLNFTWRHFQGSSENIHRAFMLLKNQAPVVTAFASEIDMYCTATLIAAALKN
jgi:hypothetical protein